MSVTGLPRAISDTLSRAWLRVSSASGPNFAASACCDGEVGSRTARAPASTRMLGCMLACFIGRSSRAPGPSEAFRCPPGFLMPRFNIGFVDIPAKMLWVHELNLRPPRPGRTGRFVGSQTSTNSWLCCACAAPGPIIEWWTDCLVACAPVLWVLQTFVCAFAEAHRRRRIRVAP